VLLPVQNLSGVAAGVRDLERTIRSALESRGVSLLAQDQLERVLARHRIRYTGGVSQEFGRALFQDAAVTAALIVAVDEFDPVDPPRVGLTARLVATGENPRVVWIESLSRAGNQAPGLFETGLVHELEALMPLVVDELADRVVTRLGDGMAPRERMRRFAPRSVYQSAAPTGRDGARLRVAVLPLTNRSGRADAGEVVALQLLRQLAEHPQVEPIEPGVVRETLLAARLIQEGGLSLAQADLLREFLDVDLIVIGRVMSYVDRSSVTVPDVAFSIQAIDASSRKVVWSSRSRRRGDEHVVFFDAGRVETAQTLTAGLAAAAVERMVSGSGRRSTRRR
jgi:TolB-like protein